jgi:hypothetical protein
VNMLTITPLMQFPGSQLSRIIEIHYKGVIKAIFMYNFLSYRYKYTVKTCVKRTLNKPESFIQTLNKLNGKKYFFHLICLNRTPVNSEYKN